jgi:hypothetical protein
MNFLTKISASSYFCGTANLLPKAQGFTGAPYVKTIASLSSRHPHSLTLSHSIMPVRTYSALRILLPTAERQQSEKNHHSRWVLFATLSIAATLMERQSETVRFARSMEEIEASFVHFDHFKPEERDQFIQKLKDSYLLLRKVCLAQDGHKLPRDLQQYAARLFHIYGRVLYTNMIPAKALFLFSLLFQLRELQIPEINSAWLKCETLDALPAFLIENQSDYSLPITDYGRKMSDSIAELGQKPAFAMAHTLRYLGHCYQNLPNYNKPTEENIRRFDNIYGLSSLILDHFDDKESLWEKMELEYNTGRFLSSLKNPSDIWKMLASLERVNKMLKSFPEDSRRVIEKRAQVHNILAIETMKLCEDLTTRKQFFKQAYANTYEAYRLAQTREDFNPFLKSMFAHNVAVRANAYKKEFGEEVASLAEIAEWFSSFKKTAEAYHYEHYYYARMFLNVACFEKDLGNLDKAQENVLIAEKVSKMFPNETIETAKEIAKEKEELFTR